MILLQEFLFDPIEGDIKNKNLEKVGVTELFKNVYGTITGKYKNIDIHIGDKCIDKDKERLVIRTIKNIDKLDKKVKKYLIDNREKLNLNIPISKLRLVVMDFSRENFTFQYDDDTARFFISYSIWAYFDSDNGEIVKVSK